MTIFGVIKMMNNFIAILAFIMTTMATQAQTPDKQAIEQLYKQQYRAMIAKDIAALDSILDDSSVLIHMTGARQKKSDYLREIEDGTLNYYSVEDDSIVVTVDGDTATMTGRSRVTAAVYGGCTASYWYGDLQYLKATH